MQKQIYVGNSDLFLVLVFSILVAELAAPSLESFGLALVHRIEQKDEAKYDIDGIWLDMAKLLAALSQNSWISSRRYDRAGP